MTEANAAAVISAISGIRRQTLSDGCNGLTTRSLSIAEWPSPTVPTVTLLKPCTTLHQVQTDASVTIRLCSAIDGCNGLTTRSLSIAEWPSPTVTPLDRARPLHQVQTRRIRHHPPADCDSRSTG
jgi:hypothetical protein